ncbi:MAG: MarC family protein [Desulfobacterales bacterium]|nr:MarC family protein [Desulfobacterales bacterium]
MPLTVSEMFLFVVGFIAIFSPFGIIGPFGGFVSSYPPRTQHKIAWRVSFNVFMVLLISGWGGQYFLTLLGITLPALTTTGGFILLLTSIPMTMQGNVSRQENVDKEDNSEKWRSIIIVPLTFPIGIGAAMISYVITYFAQAGDNYERLILTGLLCISCFFVSLTFIFAGPMTKKLGSHGTDIMVRIGGIILMSLAFMILARGITELIPALKIV